MRCCTEDVSSACWITSMRKATRAAGCAKIYSEKKTGANGDRAALQRMLRDAEPGDVVVVTRLDRRVRARVDTSARQ
jgi:DNA invertase Pin-like site-specific DNA recombinase